MRKTLVSAISLILIIIKAYSQDDEEYIFKMRFKDCNEAYEKAVESVKRDSLIYFLAPHGHEKAPDGKIKDIQLDSVLLAEYNVHVIRTGNFNWDHTVRCYSKFMNDHMDSTYNENFFIHSYNIVQRMHGDTEMDTIDK